VLIRIVLSASQGIEEFSNDSYSPLIHHYMLSSAATDDSY